MVVLFVLCQVMGLMCALPDVSAAGDNAVISDEVMACPMDANLMCPSSLASSPDRRAKSSAVMDMKHSLGATGHDSAIPIPSVVPNSSPRATFPFVFPVTVALPVLRI